MGYIAALYMAVLGKPGRVLPYSAPKQQGRSEKHRDDGAHDSDGEHADVHHVSGAVLTAGNSRPEDANGKFCPYEEERCRECKTDGESMRTTNLPRYQLIRETSAE
ncbi:hypothetical protein BH24CHL1_BH24CHL1_03620 [soil metagenome]